MCVEIMRDYDTAAAWREMAAEWSGWLAWSGVRECPLEHAATAAIHSLRMLLVLAGSSGSGKSPIRRFLLEDGAPLVAGLPIHSHDFDENGVPVDANTEWRQQSGKAWIERALEYAKVGEHLLLSANWPLGEVLATPRAPLLDGIALCLIDCGDTERAKRLRARQQPSYSDRQIWNFVLFAAWQRLHHADPSWMPEVIVGHWPEMV